MKTAAAFIVLAGSLLVLGPLLDSPANSQDTTGAITDAASSARLERAALDLCASELGLGAQVLWTVDGDLVCRPAASLTASN